MVCGSILIQYPYLDGFWSNACLHSALQKYTFFPFASDVCFASFSSTIIPHTGSFDAMGSIGEKG
jgi:20S proteasome alpha/beta subunit